jgi:Leucine-rich repeat (LRR) protein
VENNNINGALPIQLTTLTNLTELDFIGNKLSGTISFEFGGLTNLHTLYFGLNDFSGEVPLELCNLRDTDKMSNFGMPLKSDCRAYGALTCPVSHPSCCCPS